MAKRIAGIALMERNSLNGVYYHIEELRKFHGLTVPLRLNHIQEPEGIIGEATFKFDEAKHQVLYEATIFNEDIQKLVDNQQFQVSIGATPEQLPQGEVHLCNDDKTRCLHSPKLQSIDELSIVATPGVPETTMTVLEQYPTWNGTSNTTDNTIFYPTFVQTDRSTPLHERMPCGGIKKDCDLDYFTSVKPKITESKSMAEETSKPKVEEKVKVTIETDDKIEVNEPEKEAKAETEEPAKEEAKETPKESVKESKTEVDVEAISKKVEETATKEVKDILTEVRQNWTPKSEVQESTETPSFMEKEITDEEARKILENLDHNGYVKLKIDKEDWIKAHTFNRSKDGKLTEAIATSGTIPLVVSDNQVVIDKSGKTELSLRQWGKFKAVPTGANTARFYRVTVPDAGAITESPTTDITASTHTLTSVDVTCSPRGWRQVIEKSEFEDYPAALLNAIRETARVEALRDEHRLILQDLAATDHDFGGLTTEPFHIGGDGAATTTTTEEDADPVFDPDALTVAKEKLQANHDPTIGPNGLVLFISPAAFEDLYTDSGLSTYAQQGNPAITRLGAMEKLYGADIVITNELLQQNNADRNLLVVKGKAWALASQREMTIELQTRIAGQYTDVVWTHRIGVDIIDPSAYVIISTTTD